MGKGAVGMLAGYWPDGVNRYLAVPGLYLDEAIITRPAKKFPDKVAVEYAATRVTYGQLATEMNKISGKILSLTEGKNLRIALSISNPLELLKVFFGALGAHCPVFIVDFSTQPEALQKQMAAFGLDLLITDLKDRSQVSGAGNKMKTISIEELYQLEESTAPIEKKLEAKSHCIAIVGRDGHICYHSHYSFLAGAISWSAFVPIGEHEVVLNLQPLHTWEGLFGLLPALHRGASCLLGSLDDTERLATSIMAHHCNYTWLTQQQARNILKQPHSDLVAAIGENLSGVFVSVSGSFSPRSRKNLRIMLGDIPVLTVFGFPEAGPVLASHPTWYLNDSVGIPISNVDVWPINPETGNPLLVPWEAIEYAEVGIKSPMVAAGFQSLEDKEAQIKEGWLRSRMVASMDPNGIFYFRPELVRK